MHHPPPPGGIVQPNFLAIEEALGNVTFPISKRDLLDHIGEDGTVLLEGRNVDLRELVRELEDDYFESEDDFEEALERRYGPGPEDAAPSPLPTGPQEGAQSRAGPGSSGGPSGYLEPGE